jgi:hypothetical protein
MLLMASSPGAKGGASLRNHKKHIYGGNIKATFHSSFDDNFDNKC